MISTVLRSVRGLSGWGLGLFLILVTLQPLQAQRPSSIKLFPKETLAYLSIPDAQGLATRFQETSLGLMAKDPQMKPLVEQVYTAILDSSKPLQDALGVTLPELLSVPNGELAVGLVLPPESRPALLVLLDTGEKVSAVQTLLDRADRALLEAGAAKQSEQADGLEVTVYSIDGPRRRRQVVYVQKEGTLIVSTDLLAVRDLLAQWKDPSLPSFADNTQFGAVRHNVGSGSEEPQLLWFVDPVNIVREVGRGNTGATVAIALFPSLGVDGIQGVGGSVALAQGQFDSVSRMYLLLSSPRTGVVELVALDTGDVTPERWVPSQTATYTSLHWNVKKTYKKLGTLIDSFQGEGAFKRQVQQRVPMGVELDIETELLPLLAGRITYITYIQEPITPRSQSMLLGIKLTDPKAAQPIFDRLAHGFDHTIERKNYLGKSYVKFRPAELEDPQQAANQMRPCFGIVDDYLLIGRESLFEKAVIAMTDPSKCLGESLDFKLIASKAQRQSGGSRPSLFSFQRPEEGLRFLHGLANADSTRQGLERGAENNPFLKDLNKALNSNPLPSLSALQKYVAPGGAVMVSDETGIRYTNFTLRRTEN